MLQTVRRAFQVEEIRQRLFFTFLMLIVVRLGSELPTPGVDPSYIQNFFASQTGDGFNFFDAFTGGSFTQMSVFALSITPYITSSIIVQLLTIAIPKLEELQNRLMKEKEEALAGLEEETGQLLEKLQQKYDKEHGKLSDRLLNEMVRG